MTAALVILAAVAVVALFLLTLAMVGLSDAIDREAALLDRLHAAEAEVAEGKRVVGLLGSRLSSDAGRFTDGSRVIPFQRDGGNR